MLNQTSLSDAFWTVIIPIFEAYGVFDERRRHSIGSIVNSVFMWSTTVRNAAICQTFSPVENCASLIFSKQLWCSCRLRARKRTHQQSNISTTKRGTWWWRVFKCRRWFDCSSFSRSCREKVGTKGMVQEALRWVVERTFAWLNRQRRIARNYEKKISATKNPWVSKLTLGSA